ncbi:MAG: hypothetical protein AB7D28_10790 [Candidatus Berkiella sp.]
MRFGVEVHVLELMVSAGLGMLLSQYLQGSHDSQTDTAIHGMAAAGTYLVCKMGYSLASSARQYVVGDVNTDEFKIENTQKKKM